MKKRLFQRGPSRQELLDAVQTQQEQIDCLQKMLREQVQQARFDICELIKKELEVFKGNIDSRIQQAEEGIEERLSELDKRIDARIWQSEKEMGKRLAELNQSLDARVWQSEKEMGKRLAELNQSLDARVWQSEKEMGKHLAELNQSLDARIWQSEEEIGKRLAELNQSLDARIWQSEEKVGKRLDEINENIILYTGVAEEDIRKHLAELGRNLDARIWQSEEQIGQRLTVQNENIDGRVWQAEEEIRKRIDGLNEYIDGRIWNLHFELLHYSGAEHRDSSILYDDMFYWENRYGSVLSAKAVLGKILPCMDCKSVVDFGCGTGTWLWVAKNYGVSEILGIDGDYVPGNMMMIPAECFCAADLSQKYDAEKRYDLAISMEVAEHLPPESSDIFASNLCGSSDVVLFSAAHPGQGGDGHINEQPIEFWIKKFESHHYRPINIKQYFQDNSKIETWYKENVILFVKKICDSDIEDRLEAACS